MGQLIVVDEDEYDLLKIKASQNDVYKQTIDDIQKELYPDWYCVDPVNCFTANLILLMEIRDEIKLKRKKWWQK